MSEQQSDTENWILSVLRGIRSAPHMFIGGSETNLLMVYLSGYLAALLDHGQTADWSFMRSFYEWLSDKTGKTTTLGVMGLIEEEDPSKNNIKTFFKRLDEFLEETGRPVLGESANVPHEPTLRDS